MGFDYSRLQNTATRMIDRFSEADISITRTTPPTVVDGVDVPGSDTITNIPAVVNPYNESQVNNTTILTGDLQVIIKHDFEPLIDDLFAIDGKDYKAIAVQSYKPSVTALAYRVQVRK